MPISLEPTPLHLGYEEDEGVRASAVGAETLDLDARVTALRKVYITRISFFLIIYL